MRHQPEQPDERSACRQFADRIPDFSEASGNGRPVIPARQFSDHHGDLRTPPSSRAEVSNAKAGRGAHCVRSLV
jgi:hypothetical protein